MAVILLDGYTGEILRLCRLGCCLETFIQSAHVTDLSGNSVVTLKAAWDRGSGGKVVSLPHPAILPWWVSSWAS